MFHFKTIEVGMGGKEGQEHGEKGKGRGEVGLGTINNLQNPLVL